MAMLSLKIRLATNGIIRQMQFEPSLLVFDACAIIREHMTEANVGQPNEYGLFLGDDDPKKGVWLEAARSLEYYLLRNGDTLDYRSKQRILRVRMLDGSLKTMQVDDSHTVAQLMLAVCSRIGITNYEEYSLIYDPPEEPGGAGGKDKASTMAAGSSGTLRKDAGGGTLARRDQKKLDEMKKKLHTDDGLNWLDHSKTLRQQGIDDTDTLLLKRKIFFSDQNIDARDPIQLNLLYVQMKTAIINGAHPVSQEEAIQFAGIQCQIQFGDYNETKHKTGFLELKEMLPKEYVKVRGVEKKIYSEHKALYNLSEVDAKVRYTQLCRSLKTYGITFFLVKEKVQGKNKLTPRLFGVNKDSVVRVDETTKEVMRTWPLTQVRRWAASPNSFTLDFGDYSDAYYSVQTAEGEQIAQLISAYIDIILKKKKTKDHFGMDGDEESTMLEDTVAPSQATIIQHQSASNAASGHASSGSLALPAVLRSASGDGGASSFVMGSMDRPHYSGSYNQPSMGHLPPAVSRAQNAEVHGGLGHAQRALLGTIGLAVKDISDSRRDLDEKTELPALGSDAASQKWRMNTCDLSKQGVSSHLSAVNAATAHIINLTSAAPDDTDSSALGSAVHAISSNMRGLTRSVKLLAALHEQDGNPARGRGLLDAAQRMTSALGDLLKAAEPGSKEPRTTLLGAATRVGEMSADVARNVSDEQTAEDRAYEEALLALAKSVANATAALVLKAKAVASRCEDQAQQNRVIGSATQCALATSQLVSCTKVVSPTISSPACQEQVTEAAKLVVKSVDGVVTSAQATCREEKLVADVNAAALAVTTALDELLNHVRRSNKAGGAGSGEAVDAVFGATDRLFTSMGDPPEMVKQARSVAQVTSQLVSMIKGQADEQSDQDTQRRLMAAAKALAEATARMVEAAKGCASDPNDTSRQQSLRRAADDLRSAAGAAADTAQRRRALLVRLTSAVRLTCSATIQLASASDVAAQHNRNEASQQALASEVQTTNETMAALVTSVREASDSSLSYSSDAGIRAARRLVERSREMIQASERLGDAAQAAAPTVGDQSVQLLLAAAVKQLASALAELRAAAAGADEAFASAAEIDGAVERIRAIDAELLETRAAAAQGALLPLPGETAEGCSVQLGAASKTVGSSMAALLTGAAQGDQDYTGGAARETAAALQALAGAARGVAATGGNAEARVAIIDAARDVMDKSAVLVLEAKKALAEPGNPDNQTRLAQVAKAVSHSLNSCVNWLPGQREIDNALRDIASTDELLTTGKFPATTRPYPQVQESLLRAASGLSEAAGAVVTSARGSPQQLAVSSNAYGQSYRALMQEGMTVARLTKDTEAQQHIVGGLKGVSVVSSKLLLAAKSLHADPSAPNAKNLLAQAARSVTDSINALIDVCTTAAPGQKECDSALREITAASGLLDNPTEPVGEQPSYFACLDGVVERSRSLGSSMTAIASHSSDGDADRFCDAVKLFSGSVCGLTELAAQAAYLVGVADRASEPGRPGLVDASQFARASAAIAQACATLANPASGQPQVLAAATVVAKHTSALCNACRVASSQTSNPVAKRQFVQSAKDVANNTANLVKAIKVLDGEFTPANKQKCTEASKPLIEAVDKLTAYGSSPEFASVPAKISKEARRAQEPIIGSGKQMVDSARKMVSAAKQLAATSSDQAVYQQFSLHSKSLSEAMKRLITAIKDSAPGQRECDAAIETLTSCVKDVDSASLAAASQALEPRADNSLQGFQEQAVNSCRQVLSHAEAAAGAAKAEAERLGRRINALVSYVEPLCDGGVGCASRVRSSRLQAAVLDQTKTVAEAALQLVHACRGSGGNAHAAPALHAAVDEAAASLMEVTRDLLRTIEESASAAGNVTTVIDAISKAIAKVDERVAVPVNMSFVDYQTALVASVKNVAKVAQDILTKSMSPDSISELGPLAGALAKEYAALSEHSQGACSVAPSSDVAGRLRTRVQDLGASCVGLVQNAGSVQVDPADSFARRDLAENARLVSEKVASVLAVLHESSRGTQACINAVSVVSGIVADLDTTVMFATSGTLNAQSEKDVFADHRESILKMAKALVEDTKALVHSATASQEELATAVQSSVKTISRLADVVKLGAASLGSDQPEAQVLLINAVKDVASALTDLIGWTKNATGKPAQDPALGGLKDSAKVMVTNVTSLLKTVKTVEDEAARGTRALEAAIEAIVQELRVYMSVERVEHTATPEELIGFTKHITSATAKTVAAGNSCRQEDVIAAANMGRKAVCDLLGACKGASVSAENQEVKGRTLVAGRTTAENYKLLLELLAEILQKPGSADLKRQLPVLSKSVAIAVGELVQNAEALKGSDWVDPEDPAVIAESELLGAARSIEAAAKKLATLKPRPKTKEADENLNFDEQILEAAKSIAAATAALVKSASAAQRELVAQGRMRGGAASGFNEDGTPAVSVGDGQWSQGLISAARLVATATHSLCEAANAMVHGTASEEMLISAAKQVAGSTAQLLVACKVKADPDSVAMKRLQAAGNAVKRATEALVKAAQQVKEREDEENVAINQRMVGGVAQLINIQAEILEKEKELEKARMRLAELRKQKYKDVPLEDTDRVF